MRWPAISPEVLQLRGRSRQHICDNDRCRDERDRLSRQNVRLHDKRARDFDEGLLCAVRMIEEGASTDDVRLKVRRTTDIAAPRSSIDPAEMDTRPMRALKKEEIDD